MADQAIIFDVDGVLLELTRAEEDIFFCAFEGHGDTAGLSRDWNSYLVRNDEAIMAEIAHRLHMPAALVPALREKYLAQLGAALEKHEITSRIIAGADGLLASCAKIASLGIATANFKNAARLRLHKAGLWHWVKDHAFGADGGGHKSEILARALEGLNVPKSKIIYVGDNVNDVEAGRQNGVKFIGFSTDPARRATLKAHGAENLSKNHAETWRLIHMFCNS
jgi:phosphoglycolate phosphatase-like HAD superfamily hydrolase